MTRFTLFQTITDSLGRVHGTLWVLNDGIQRKPPNEPINANESLTERARLIDKKIKTRYERRSELRRRAKGSDPPIKNDI